MTEQKMVRAAAYCRLSKDDGNEGESCSIDTQRRMIRDFIQQHGFILVDEYCDDGYSGRNFERPEFKRMLEDIEKGRINCVITKDLSRFGRNYLEAGIYQEVFFPRHQVRYIAINDGVDTANEDSMAITPFRNILNEMYSDDISKKVRSALRTRFTSGKFRAAAPPYGYLKDPADHNHLVIDEKAAPIVRMIFDLAEQGMGTRRIRKRLQEKKVLCPSAYSVSRGDILFSRWQSSEHDPYGWSENSVRNILRNPTYAGHLVGYKRVRSGGKKSKKRISLLPEQWQVIPNTHEPIISQSQFDLVQGMITRRRGREPADGYENIFLGLLRCPDCGSPLCMQTAHRVKDETNPLDRVAYQCGKYVREGVEACSNHSIEAVNLFQAVQADIQRLVDMTMQDETVVMNLLESVKKQSTARSDGRQKEKQQLTHRQRELNDLFAALYEDKVAGRISSRNYDMMSARYDAEQDKVSSRLQEIEAEMSEAKQDERNVEDFSRQLRRCQAIVSLDAPLLNSLIDKIEVFGRVPNEDGIPTQTIKIYYKFIGVLDDLIFEAPDRAPRIATRICRICGEQFIPGSNVAKYCPSCAKRRRAEQINQYKKVSREKERQERLQGHPYGKKACPVCGKEFWPERSGRQTYCSEICKKQKKAV